MFVVPRVPEHTVNLITSFIQWLTVGSVAGGLVWTSISGLSRVVFLQKFVAAEATVVSVVGDLLATRGDA